MTHRVERSRIATRGKRHCLRQTISLPSFLITIGIVVVSVVAVMVVVVIGVVVVDVVVDVVVANVAAVVVYCRPCC